MNKILFGLALFLAAGAIVWMGSTFVGVSPLALAVTTVIGCGYAIGVLELIQFRRATASLSAAIGAAPSAPDGDPALLERWLTGLDVSLRNAVRSRIEGGRTGLPVPVFTPYLVGLLVMLGLLGTFVGMVETLTGAVTALEGSTELEAIRSGLAAPIAGLAIAFGTSVAGVAASAMLGLQSTLSRRDRMLAMRALDDLIAREFRTYALTYQQQQGFRSLQTQAEVLPGVADTLSALARRLNAMGDGLGVTLAEQQAAARAESLQAFAAQAERLDRQSDRLAECLLANQAEAQAGIATNFESLAARLERLGEQLESSLLGKHEAAHAAIGSNFEQLAARLQDQGRTVGTELLDLQTAAQDTLRGQFETLAESMAQVGSTFERVLHTNLDESRATTRATFEQLADSVGQSMRENLADSGRAAGESIRPLLADTLASLAEEARATQQQLATVADEQMTAFGREMRGSATAAAQAVREEFAAHWQRASEQAVALQETLNNSMTSAAREFTAEARASTTALLGEMDGVLADTSQTQRAAADAIGTLRQEVSEQAERDRALLEERAGLLRQLEEVTQSLQESAGQQRKAVLQLTESTADTLQKLGAGLSEKVGTEVAAIGEVAAGFAASSADMASLGESFGVAVQQYNDANRELMERLDSLECAMQQATARSDEQMGYYVAQAREIIDQSVLSQREVIDALRRAGEAGQPLSADAV